MWTRRTLSLRHAFFLAVFGVLVTAWPGAADPESNEPQEDAARFRVRVLESSLSDAVLRAVVGAYDRLDQPRCRRLFDEFSDATGAPLSSALRVRGVTARAHLARLFFYGGEPRGACERGLVAGTKPGGSAILVCPLFERLSSDVAQAIVIHELLHTLGLGENPPSSLAITRRVMQRCAS